MTIYIDFETRGTRDLRKTGVEAYTEDPHFDAICLCWTRDDEPVRKVRLIDRAGVPADLAALFAAVERGETVVAHNARFELTCWRVMRQRRGWPRLVPEQVRCTMAMAFACSLPGALEKAATALRLPVVKDDAGRRLMLRMCKPLKDAPGAVPRWLEDDASIARLMDYCATDVEVERLIYQTLPRLSAAEQELWVLDQRINDRGVAVDLSRAATLLDAAKAETKRLDCELRELTGNAVPSVGAAAKFLAWLATQGVKAPDLKKATVARLLADKACDKKSPAGRALLIRQEASKASTKKLAPMLDGACADGRLRGLFQYHGAGTGRWAGRRVQPQNMPRIPKGFNKVGSTDTDELVSFLQRGAGKLIRAQYNSILSPISWSLRSLLVAAPGKELIAADFANIEGRVLAWLAGEAWKIQAFRDYDAGTGPDLYVLAFSRSFGVPVADVTEDQRQLGKVQELALGYQGAIGAFLSMAAGYGIDLADLVEPIRASISPADWGTLCARYDEIAGKKIEPDDAGEVAEDDDEPESELSPENLAAMVARRNFMLRGLPRDQWVAVRAIVDRWRAAHPRIVEFWRALESAAIEAVAKQGTVQAAGLIRYQYRAPRLVCTLPSGRELSYPFARLAQEETIWPDGSKSISPKLLYEGVSSRTHKWGVQKAYGGLLAENVTQAAARDCLSDAMTRVEASEFPVVMHVHDEVVAEVPRGSNTLNQTRFEALMATIPPWASGLPIAFAGWTGPRYRK